jgi:hypothetical protein
MFGKTYKTVLTLDADDKPTAIASSTSESVFQGVIGHLTSHFTADTVYTGLGRELGGALMVYAPMVLTNWKLTNKLRFNPLSDE